MGRPRKYGTIEERNAAENLAKRRRREEATREKQEIVRQQDVARHQIGRASQSQQSRDLLNAINAERARMARESNATRNRMSLQRLREVVNQDESQVCENYCGTMDTICEACGSKNFPFERPSDGKFTQCCQKGKVELPLHEYPTFLRDLMTGVDRHSRNFLDNIRSLNSSFAFASMGAKIAAPPGRGPYCFRIHGQIYHRTGALHPPDNEPRMFSQLYILDPDEATAARMSFKGSEGCNPELMRKLALFMEENNGFAKAYKMLHAVEEEAKADALARGSDMPNIAMAIKQNRDQDPRRYNNPRVSEVAVVFENSDGEPPYNRDILIHLKSNPADQGFPQTQRISILHKNIDALVYPIFFPRGESGWGEDLRHVGGEKQARVSQLQWYSYMLSVRDFNPLLNGGRLTQQYFVDAYVKIEANRLNFIRTHQADLRVEDYNIVQESMKNVGQPGFILGKTIVLPSSFEGSPRNMQQRYQDAMSIVTKFGKPDLFITMTCNPKWREITENLNSWQKSSPENRPDLTARVFKLKLDSLLADIMGGLFGEVKAKVHVIEFQKRGLPHAHILLILDVKDKLRDEQDIDRIVSAEIPDRQTHPDLHDLVLLHMVHGPCGKLNPNCPCMDNGVCSKGFPKPFSNSTLGNVNGYPIYRRRIGEKFKVRGHYLDNASVVPYNPYLLKKYNCHINVEVCATVKSVKYLFKYVYKGHDAANIEIAMKDEASNFVDSRYVSPPEAAWRIWTFPMHHQTHTIVRLAVHLENAQPIYFHEGDDVGNLEKRLSRLSTLMAWFNLNRTNAFAQTLTYREIPKHFVYKKGEWVERQRGSGKVIGRMYTVSPNDQERYFLRLLLLHVKGATSFVHLRTIDQTLHDTFKEAAAAFGLLLDDSVWRLTLEDAVVFAMPSKLRELFAYIYICVFGPPSNPKQLWDSFKDYMFDDICRRVHRSDEICLSCESYAMRDVQDILKLHRQTFADFGLPEPAKNLPYLEIVVDELGELTMAAAMKKTLNLEQQMAFDKI